MLVAEFPAADFLSVRAESKSASLNCQLARLLEGQTGKESREGELASPHAEFTAGQGHHFPTPPCTSGADRHCIG